ncbi:hypothetical protein [Streptomyces coelicoflavus]|uniref:hypothetical protein n=1 Tax=Streptomyces coelicoflavus TaxID=285562 RepID=UPI001EF335B9|nr:hypothetical protein [Streptomyces coelicoflavus]
MQRVLYLLNVSNPHRLSADSGFTFAELLTPAFADAGAEVTLASPAPVGDPRIRYVPTVSPSTSTGPASTPAWTAWSR